jgi:serine/threonine protein kinase
MPGGMSIESGTRIGAYEVRSRLGEGAMGLVFRAHDAKLQRDVALKVLPEHFAADPDRLARFQREAQLLASLNHQNIAIPEYDQRRYEPQKMLCGRRLCCLCDGAALRCSLSDLFL